MIGRLIARHVVARPVRSLVFVGAYAAGVGVMLALLSIGEVMVTQARDETWVGGGDVTVLPAGADLETLRLGGAVFYGLDQARFVMREILDGPRLADAVEAAAPWIEDRALYLRGSRDTSAVRASGWIPSAARELGVRPALTSGDWTDSDADRRWLQPTPMELYSEIDRFHLPDRRLQSDSSWAEWHYFNLSWPDEERWLYLSYIVAGDVRGSRHRGLVLARYRTPDGRDRAFIDTVPAGGARFSTTSPDLALGPHRVQLLDGPARYEISARLADRENGTLEIDVRLQPHPHRYFPPARLAASDSLLSGYVVPALRATASGRVCLAGTCRDARPALGYHDHNWGTWSGVTWDWGIAHAGEIDVLYGGLHGADADAARRRGIPFIVYVADSLGVAGVLSLDSLSYSGRRIRRVAGNTVPVPERLTWTATRGADTLTAEITIRSSSVTPAALEAGASAYFAQMRGSIDLHGTLGGRRLNLEGSGFFETYLRPEGSEPETNEAGR